MSGIVDALTGAIGRLYAAVKGKQATDYQFVQIGPAGAPIEIDKHYVAIRLLSFRITKVRNWGTEYTGAVHSFCTLNDVTQGKAEYQQVSRPSKLAALDGQYQDRVISINTPILDQVPYEGGLAIQAGLFSVKAGDAVANFLKLAGDVSDKAGVAFLKVAQPFFPIVQSAADLFLGNAKQASLEIGIDIEFPLPNKPFTSGNYALVQATKAQLDASKLTLDANDFRLLDSRGQDVTAYPYMVIGIVGSQSRDNWMQSPDLRDGWNGIRTAVSGGKQNEADERIKAFRYTCKGSADLLPLDAEALWKRAEARYAASPTGGAAAKTVDAGDKLGELAELSPFQS